MEEPEAPLQRATAIKGFAATRNARNFRAEFSVAAARERGSATPATARRQQIYMLKFIIGREIQPERGLPAGVPMSRDSRLSRRDEVLVDFLIETGIPKNIAKTLVFLSKREETTSVEIEKATGLRQPEGSIAMQELRRRRGVEKRGIQKEGEGRP